MLGTLCLAAASAAAATEASIDIYEGPTTCEAADKAEVGKKLTMHYVGTIDASSKTGLPGKQFDSSRSRAAFSFVIGRGQVIEGWDTLLVGLCKGAKAKLIVPPDKGYGAGGAGADIPGGATLNFDVELLEVAEGPPPPPPPPNVFRQIDTDGDDTLSPAEVAAFFEAKGASVPEALWDKEDKDGDGFIGWEEFSGPKGDAPPATPKEEL